MNQEANFGIVIQTEDIEKVVPEAWAAFDKKLQMHDTDLEAFAIWLAEEGDDEDIQDSGFRYLLMSYYELQEAFVDKTQIELYLNYHESEPDGTTLDDVEGAFFSLPFTDVYDYTPAAQALDVSGVRFGVKYWISLV